MRHPVITENFCLTFCYSKQNLESLELCNGKGNICLDCLIQELVNEDWREEPMNIILKTAYDKGIKQNSPLTVIQLSKEDRERLEFIMVLVYVANLPFSSFHHEHKTVFTEGLVKTNL